MTLLTGGAVGQMPFVIEQDFAIRVWACLRFIRITMAHPAIVFALDIVTTGTFVHRREVAVVRRRTALDLQVTGLTLDLHVADMQAVRENNIARRDYKLRGRPRLGHQPECRQQR